ncbi:MAG: hypothetical protein AAF809_07155 [Bacteroidota bacterium]
MPQKEAIAEVGIDEQRRLYLKPTTLTFTHIYREAAGIRWDRELGCLYSQVPQKWTYLQWFQRIAEVTKHVCGWEFTPSTKWANIPDDVRQDMEVWLDSWDPDPLLTEEEKEHQHHLQRLRTYHAEQEPSLKARARELFRQERYEEVMRLESRIRYPEFLSGSERKMFKLARERV